MLCLFRPLRGSQLRAFALVLTTLTLIAATGSAQDTSQRVIVLGFDGVDPDRCREYFERNELPHLQQLAETGSFGDLQTTYPVQSPVSWSTFITGQNPGYHGIYDFLYRMPFSYSPDIALARRTTVPLLASKLQRGLIALGLGFAVLLTLFGIARVFRVALRASVVVGCLGMIAAWGIGYTAMYHWLPYELPKPESRRSGKPFWEYAAEAGYRCKVLDMPVTFPAVEKENVKLTTGLGTPDARATWGIFSLYSTQEFESRASETGGILTTLQWNENQTVAEIMGPALVPAQGDAVVPMKITRLDSETLLLELSGEELELRVGEWSDFVSVGFAANPLLRMVASTRFKLLELEPELRLYQEPLNLHACHLPPTVDISSPREWACELAEEYGPRETLGWSIATNPLRDEVIDIESFLEDLYFTLERRERVFLGELEKDDWDLFLGVFLSTDRMQHMMYRFIDPGHPHYDEALARRYGDQVLEIYRQMDRIVGLVMDRHVDEDTVLMVVSDHGFHSYRYGVNLNTWLAKNGHMTLEGPLGGPEQYQRLEDLFDPDGSFYKNVNWAKTKAYCMGLGSIYINLQLREPQGSVSTTQYEVVRQEIIDGLKALEDPRFPGVPVVLDVVRREDVFHGPRLLEAPDLLICFNENYRVSWQTSLGGVPPEVIEDNLDNWSGDHCSYDPSISQGIFFSNRELPDHRRGIEDIGATALQYLGLEVPKDMDGSPLQAELTR